MLRADERYLKCVNIRYSFVLENASKDDRVLQKKNVFSHLLRVSQN